MSEIIKIYCSRIFNLMTVISFEDGCGFWNDGAQDEMWLFSFMGGEQEQREPSNR